ncbi:hypothetical protein VNO77_36854 [Canavalia gladiata]|uniref:Uncharacterized protein n=1 Tax=Canavalia gladiata TaxID=3824 RepID=A0AAN9PY06_CANGL
MEDVRFCGVRQCQHSGDSDLLTWPNLIHSVETPPCGIRVILILPVTPPDALLARVETRTAAKLDRHQSILCYM